MEEEEEDDADEAWEELSSSLEEGPLLWQVVADAAVNAEAAAVTKAGSNDADIESPTAICAPKP